MTQIKKVFDTGKPLYSYDRVERIAHSDRIMWVDAMLLPVRDDDGKTVSVLGITRDITERKKINEELARSSKLESLGTLAGGLAHDFNNVLMGVIGNLALAKKRAAADEKLLEILCRTEKIAYKAKSLTEQLITFSRGGAPYKKVMRLNELIVETAQFATTGSNSSCVFDLDAGQWPCEADEGQLAQVFTNIVINSKQSMPDGGEIAIRAVNVVIDEGAAGPVAPGRYVRVSFADNGSGIAAEDISKVFDPFFSKKEGGKGLGLATAYSIIKKHSGTITVDSVPGAGTTVSILIPAADQGADQPEKSRRAFRPADTRPCR